MAADRSDRSLLVLDGAVDGLLDAMVTATTALRFDDQDLGRNALRARSRAAAERPDLAEDLWRSVAPHLPAPREWFDPALPPPVADPPIDGWMWSGLNPLLRWYRYEVGAEFPAHVDEPWRPDPGRRSLLTLLVFLPTDECVGGETVVGTEVVAAVSGRIALFDHRVRHAGRPVERGSKLVLRTDVVAIAASRSTWPTWSTAPDPLSESDIFGFFHARC